MIAVAQTGDNVWAVSLNGEDLTIMQHIADVLQTDIKGVIAGMMKGGMKGYVKVVGDMFGDNGNN